MIRTKCLKDPPLLNNYVKINQRQTGRKSRLTIKMIEAPNTVPTNSKGKDTDSSSDINDEDASELSVSSEKGENSSSADDSSNTSPHDSNNGSANVLSTRFGLFQGSNVDGHINSAKCAFLTFLLMAAIGLGVTVYFTTAADDVGDFQAIVSPAIYEGVCRRSSLNHSLLTILHQYLFHVCIVSSKVMLIKL
jgi:hypothetical protein